MRTYFVYILASERNGTLYVGVTNDLERRVAEHKTGKIEGFSKKNHTHSLVYFEKTTDVHTALQREKQLKRWRREWKLALIERDNLHWQDLSLKLFGLVI